MIALVKHHFLTIDLTSYIIIPLIICMGYIAHVPPMPLFFVTVISIPIIIYFLENKNNVDRFLVSLPVSTFSIIRSQYMFAILMATIILLLQMLIMVVGFVMLDTTHYIYDWQDISILLSIAMIIPAVTIPLYQIVRSFLWSTVVISVLYVLGILFSLPLLFNVLNMTDYISFNDLDAGLSLVVEKHLPYQPYPILFITAIILFHVSMILSHRLYTLKDH